ncbi:hypothetical protein DFH07DRAFT_831056 [Mycena maculata]|uniref:Uncharacterized protein n=1 Tax=Mycena maculata TaxID=230809 RepID=A0AAD7IP00_9AGAR|nr:hypothetical protein DFH07DRAFT_831056 [Mycena maculata]
MRPASRASSLRDASGRIGVLSLRTLDHLSIHDGNDTDILGCKSLGPPSSQSALTLLSHITLLPLQPSAMDYTVDSTLFTVYWQNVLRQLYSLAATLVLYGIYLVLFSFSVYTLSRRESARALLVASWAMAILGTAQVLLHLATTGLSLQMVDQVVVGETTVRRPDNTLLRATQIITLVQACLLVTNNFVADGLFLYRSYLIWGPSQKRVMILPGTLILATTVLGYLTCVNEQIVGEVPPFFVDGKIVFIMMVLTNLLLTLLTAGRIFWIRRKVTGFIEPTSRTRYETAITIILESGAMYCVSTIALVIGLSRASSPTLVSYSFFAPSAQTVKHTSDFDHCQGGHGMWVPGCCWQLKSLQ